MPTYDYVCKECSHEFEHFQTMTSDLLTDCPECEKPKLRRLIGSGAGVIFKGSGFFQTDYRSESYKKDAKAAKDAAKPKSDKKTDTSDGAGKKTEKKTEPKKKSDG